jgi:copper chaperone NosL
MMTKGSRILVLVAALALGLVYVLPMWRIDLEAPQYPEGLGMVISIDDIVGVKQHDLRNINNLNHYIGMKTIEPDSIPEMRIMPVVVGVLIGLGLLVAAFGRRKLLYGWAGIFSIVAIAGLVDFWKWEYDYGHDLDQETAIIKIPGMSYQPPLIGRRQILNFTAHSWPASGGWIAIVVGGLVVGTAVSEFRRAGGKSALQGALAIGVALSASGCGDPGPREIAFGAEACEQCLMAVQNDGHPAQMVTENGRSLIFDSIECLAAYLHQREEIESVASLWVTDFSDPPALISVDEAAFLVSPTLASPMGLGITAFSRVEDRDGAVNAFGGRAVDWAGVRALVDERWPDGRPPHGGHSETMSPEGHGD